MGAISFSVDRKPVELLAASLGLDSFIETGTFHGDSIAVALDLFRSIISIEIDANIAEAARGRFHDVENVTIHTGSSPEVLSRIVSAPGADLSRAFFWLDAHWCDSAGSDGRGQCPLIAELRAIGPVGDRAVIAIDDARLFLSPPSAAHVQNDWPEWDNLIRAIAEAAPDHRTVVCNDVIWVIPFEAFPVFRSYAERNGVDWLDIAEKARTYDRLLVQLHEKDAEIVRLGKENEARLLTMAGIQAEAERRARLIEDLDRQLHISPAAPIENIPAELEARGRLLTQLDMQLREANADRIAQAKAITESDVHRQSAERRAAEAQEHAAAAISQLAMQEAALAQSAAESETRSRLIAQLDAQLKEANADRIAQAKAIAESDAHRQSAERHAAEAQEHAAAAMAQLSAQETVLVQSAAESETRARLIAQLDAQLKEANADRIAQAKVIAASDIHRQTAERHAAEAQEHAAAAMAQLTEQEARLAQSVAESDARARLIAQLDAQLREANADRIAQAKAIADANAHRQAAERHAAEAQEHAASAMADLTAHQAEMTRAETELAARGRLIAQLDAYLQEANADRIARGEVIGGLEARLGELERQAAPLAAAAARTAALDIQVAEAAAALRAAKEQLEALRHERSVLGEQAAELVASAQGAHARAEAAERECAARQVVIDELVRSRDAYAAALAGRHQPWYAAVMSRFRKSP